MRIQRRSLCLFIVVPMLLLSFVAPVSAAAPDFDFFKGKTITYIVATKPGGGYDVFARLIGKYMTKYIPGSNVIVTNVPGAGHIIGANEVYLAKPDGLTMGTFTTGLVYSQIVGLPGVRFDLAKYSWIGKAQSSARVFLVGLKSPYKSIKEVVESKSPIKMATSGVGSSAHNETLVVAAALAANLKPIPGYAGRDAEMGMLRGEVDGTIGSYDGLHGFIEAKECRVLLQIAGKKHKELQDVPLSSELNLTEKGKRLIGTISANAELARLTAAPPNVPPERLAVLRTAYEKALADPDLLQEGRKIGIDFDPGFGEEVEKMMIEVMNQPPENITLLKNVIKID